MKGLFLLACSAAFSIVSLAQYSTYPPQFDSLVLGEVDAVKFYAGANTISMEIPPWTIGGGWHTYFAHNGISTVTYSVPEAITPKEAINCAGKGGYFATGPVAQDPWKRNYSGIYSAHHLQNPYAGTIDIGFCHNENRNECNGSANTIDPNVPINCNNPYQGYFAMVSAVWTPDNSRNNWGQQGYSNDLGPILWPSNGFVGANGVTQITDGLLQPSSIVYNGYIYVFIWDKGPLRGTTLNEEGRRRGIKLVRVSLESDLDPTQYQVYYKDTAGNVEWLPSLPAGLTKENMLDYVRTQGPKATDILPDELNGGTEAYRFTAAQVKGQDYFIGLEEYVDYKDITNNNGVQQPRHHLAIRYSPDLINWSARIKILETSDSWNASSFNYPILLSDDGWSNTEVDLTSFYVLGTHSQSPFIDPLNIMHIAYPTPTLNTTTQLQAPRLASAASASGGYPNPTSGRVNVFYYLNLPSNVTIRVMDMMGRVLSQNVTQMDLGNHTSAIDLSNYSRGVYLIQVLGEGQTLNFKIVRL